ncbi:MAG: hypothetical protein K0R51_3287 [Cytophagaceae bacterium]|jgi:hypothetical protein|nr:hypothetical protein [Cytophagaceae bacterium]
MYFYKLCWCQVFRPDTDGVNADCLLLSNRVRFENLTPKNTNYIPVI